MQDALAQQDWPLLVQMCRQVLGKNRRQLRAHRLLGFALNQLHQTDAALSAYQEAITIWPNDAELLINYAGVLQTNARHGDARPLLEKVCKLSPQHAISWIKLAQNCYNLQQHEKGFTAAQKAVALASSLNDRVAALNQRAIHRRELGQIHEAVQDCEAAIRLQPRDPANHTNRLLFMLADPTVNAQQVAAAAREYANVFEPELKPYWPDFATQRHGPWRRLRIGFLSPDFRTHAVMYFVEGLLAQLDRRQFEVFAFYLDAHEDAVTLRVQHHADHFSRLAKLSTQEQVQRIREQGIDILIDLAGHTGGNGLLAMAHRLAPVQVSWIGYPATTGLTAIDYKFTDEVTDPPGADDQYSERLYRLPTFFCCYRPMSRQPLWRYQPRYLVRSTPALSTGHITFGCCNNLGKLTDEVLTLWGRLLTRLPQARLLIEGKSLDNAPFAASYRERCARLGIDPQRLDLVPLNPSNQYLTYHQIDIALDPFPLTGGTTTCDVLWMGVPVVSMAGDSFKSRLGTGLLTYLGRSEWLARAADEYLEIAVALASDVQQLNALRLRLRHDVEQSVLMREDLFCQHFGEGLRVMWLQWLAQGQCPDDPQAQNELMQSWLPSCPPEWQTAPTRGVGLEPGRRVSLQEAHAHLQHLLDAAKTEQPTPQRPDRQIHDKCWEDVTNNATLVLSAVPHDPLALACLAEVEHAHGNTEFAVTYLRHAQEAIAQGNS
ncbi:MAG: acetylglucosamine transferase [Hylemonella sp.]|nr:acetylglucosamine transferase [Hylemonella sp.]